MVGADVVQTYGIEIFNQTTYEALLDHWERPGGCRDRLVKCRVALRDRDAGVVPSPNISSICEGIEQGCAGGAPQLYERELNVSFPPHHGDNTADSRNQNSWYDITHPKHDPFPPKCEPPWTSVVHLVLMPMQHGWATSPKNPFSPLWASPSISPRPRPP